MIIDNRDQQPTNVYLSKTDGPERNTGKTWLLPDIDDSIMLTKLVLKGRAHLAVSLNHIPAFSIKTSLLEGDFSGQFHISSGIDLSVEKSSPFFPASFRVYENGSIGLPENVTLDSFANKDVSIEGSIEGVKDLAISSGVRVLLGNKVRHSFNSYSFCLLQNSLF